MLLSFIIGALIAAGVTAAVVAIIRAVEVKKRLRELQIKQAQTRFATLFREGNYEHVATGIWDTNSASVSNGDMIKAEQIEPEIQALLPRNEVILLDE